MLVLVRHKHKINQGNVQVGEDNLQKFVEHMRAAGQPDEMIADSLIAAGNNEIMVLNALGISTLDELEDENEVEPTPIQQPLTTTRPVVDDDGNLLFAPNNEREKTTQKPEPKQPLVSRDQLAERRSYPKPQPRHSKPIVQKSDEESDEPDEMQTPKSSSTPSAEPSHDHKRRPSHRAAPDAFALHGNVLEKTVHRAGIFQAESKHENIPQSDEQSHQDADEVDQGLDRKQDTLEEHAHHHKPHHLDEIIEDIEAHHALEAGYDDEIEPGEIEPIKRVKTTEIKTPPKAQPHNEEGHPDEEPLPQEIAVEELEAIDEKDTSDLERVADEAKQAQAEIDSQDDAEPKQINNPDALVVPSSPEISKLGQVAGELQNNTTLKIILILCLVAMLIGLAALLAFKITSQAASL
jgi:hypothetical protein